MEEDTAKRSWLCRKWKRLAAIILGLVLVVSAIVLVAFHHAEATALALASARSNPELVARLGEPMRPAWFIGGTIVVTQGFGNAELAIPIAGPKGKGTIYVAAAKTAGIWKLTLLQFGADGEAERLQLLRQ